MKTRLSLFCITLALIAANVAEAQLGHTFSDQNAAPAFQSVSGDLVNTRGAAGPDGLVEFGLKPTEPRRDSDTKAAI